MDPVTLGVISLGMTAVSGVMGFMGAQEQASAQAAAANYQAQVAQNNAIINNQNAARAAEAGRAQAQATDFKNAARSGAILAAEGASGIDVGSGSSTEVRQSAQQLGRLDTQTVMDNAMRQVRAYQVAATSDTAQAQLDTFEAEQAKTAGMIQGFGSIVSAASSFADKWTRYTDQGIFGGGYTPTPQFGTGGIY